MGRGSSGSLTEAASLRPLAGGPRDIERLLGRFLREDRPDPVVVQTAGSTGRPKSVALAAAALRVSAAATLDRLGGPGQWVLALPATYVAGLQVLIRSQLAGTSPVLLGEHPDLAAATTALTADRRYLAAVPTQLYRWLEDPVAAATMSSFDAVLVGGAAATPELVGRARDRGIRVVTTYGLTETCGGCVYDGVPLDTVATALGPAGEIRVAGPVLFDGYVDEPERTAAVLRDGWLHTQDLGSLDADGRLVVHGRADDVVVSGGVNVSLAAVEQRLGQLPSVGECAVLAVPDDEWGVRVFAVVTEAAPSLDQVRDFVAEVLPRSWAPRELIRVATLPRLSSGKVDRQLLRTRAARLRAEAPQ